MASSTAAPELNALAHRLLRKAQDVAETGSADTDPDLRVDIVRALDRMAGTVRDTREPHGMVMWFMAQISCFTAIRLFLKWNAFEKLPIEKEAAISWVELADVLRGDVALITRIGQILVAHGILKHVASGRVAHTHFSKSLLAPAERAIIELGFDVHAQSWMCMPKYFDHFGLVDPNDSRQTSMAFGEGRLGSTPFDIIYADEERRKAFIACLVVNSRQNPALGKYDLNWVTKQADRSSSRALVVDVGGGDGRALVVMFKAWPSLARHRCVLEDLPEVIGEARHAADPNLAGVQMVPADFNKEQPIKGALLYYLRQCLHNHPDDKCVTLLQILAGAMAPDSRLLIVEALLGDPVTTHQAALDLMMMGIGGRERTLAMFEEMLSKAGLRITQVLQTHELSATIECMLA